mmetsp:Transcript_43051/g.71567  ORF Transcript_43051/g.71567 Transcript_43051/m.71567 type:complete len:292 (+) Transcript_43051:67-942(+)|eukprot:CAMPEP_0119301564 /NCGR_PEP_ID=MMETSP1333-20130426/3327_1 /TAXON_ID=418940 /ORGANISM="Scyphosphaera apsteinii, Strain RCC1455" /LENGTH=291 /DNA_ID=CAMNT_0007303679 /DNA_START=66 /DNA_END=941 /DNA_ORIENTATION=-
MELDECFKVLNVPRNAGEEDINKAYKKLAVKFHPDKNPNNREKAEELFKKVSEAYEVITTLKRLLPLEADLVSPPRGWPACFKDEALQSYLQKDLKGRRVRLCGLPNQADLAAVSDLEMTPNDSLRNAELIRFRMGGIIVGGFGLYERTTAADDVPPSDRFVAISRYWNQSEKGQWVDFTPRNKVARQLVLIESPLTEVPKYEVQTEKIYTKYRGVRKLGENKFFVRYTGEFKDQCASLGTYTTARAASAAWEHFAKHHNVDEAMAAGRAAEALGVGPLPDYMDQSSMRLK